MGIDPLRAATAQADAGGFAAEAAVGRWLLAAAEMEALGPFEASEPDNDHLVEISAPWSFVALEPEKTPAEGQQAHGAGGDRSGGGAEVTSRRPSQDLSTVSGALLDMGWDYMPSGNIPIPYEIENKDLNSFYKL